MTTYHVTLATPVFNIFEVEAETLQDAVHEVFDNGRGTLVDSYLGADDTTQYMQAEDMTPEDELE